MAHTLKKKSAPASRRPVLGNGHLTTHKTTGKVGKTVVVAKADKASLTGKRKPAFSHPVYASEAEYDAAVDAFVAGVRSGKILPREPDEDDPEDAI